MPVIAPIIAVAASGFAVSSAIAGGAALLSFATLTAVSSVVGAVGVITKNKTLMTIGLVGAAVGGIGQWAQSTGAFGAGTAATKVADVAPATLPTGGSALPVAGAPPAPFGAAAPAGIETITVSTAPYANATVAQNTALAAGGTAAAAATTSAEAPSAEKPKTPTAEKIEPPEDNGFLKGFKEFAKDNGALLVLGGTTLSGLFEQPAPGSVERTRAETELLASQALEKKTQLANMQAPLASFTPPAVQGYRGVDPITGRQVQYATRTAADPGLINTVTGAPV